MIALERSDVPCGRPHQYLKAPVPQIRVRLFYCLYLGPDPYRVTHSSSWVAPLTSVRLSAVMKICQEIQWLC